MHFDVTPTIILLSVAGSHAYGMNTAQSDIDIRGIAIAPLDLRLSSYQRFEQYEGKWPYELFPAGFNFNRYEEITGGFDDPPDDVVIYDIAKAVKLMGDCNPNMLEILFSDDEDVLFATKLGDNLRSKRDLFLSTKLKHTYTGYARAQLSRIQRHRGYLMGGVPEKPSRTDYGLPAGEGILNQKEHNLINEEIKAKLTSWDIQDFEMKPQERDVLRQRMREFWSHAMHCTDDEVDGKLEDVAAKSLGLTEEVRDALGRERSFRSSMKNFKSYVSWKTQRNPKRQALEEKHGYDTKHASHLIRLARTGVEVLTTGKIQVRRPDAEELLGIRRGERSFEDIEEEATTLEEHMNLLYKANPAGLPKKVDTEALDRLTRETILMSVK